MMKTGARAVISLVLLVGLVGIGGCAGEENTTAPSLPSIPMEVNLSLSNAPALNETAELTCTITSTSDFGAPNTTAQITLPEGFELISGNLSWHGDIVANGQESFNIVIKSVKTGIWTITASAGYPIPDGWYGDEDHLYISVSEGTALVSKTSPCFPIELNLSISDAPALNETAELTCTITSTSVFGAPNTIAKITLPPGLELISGNLSWEGDIPSNGQESFNLIIKSVKIGNWTIEASAAYPVPDGWCGDADCLFISVSEDTTLVSKECFLSKWWEMAQRLDDIMELNLSISNAPALNETADVTCTVVSSADAPDARIRIYFYQGLELVAGDLEWTGNLTKDVPVQLQATIKPIKIGTWCINAEVLPSCEDAIRAPAYDHLYITVAEDSATVSHTNPSPEETVEPEAVLPD